MCLCVYVFGDGGNKFFRIVVSVVVDSFGFGFGFGFVSFIFMSFLLLWLPEKVGRCLVCVYVCSGCGCGHV